MCMDTPCIDTCMDIMCTDTMHMDATQLRPKIRLISAGNVHWRAALQVVKAGKRFIHNSKTFYPQQQNVLSTTAKRFIHNSKTFHL